MSVSLENLGEILLGINEKLKIIQDLVQVIEKTKLDVLNTNESVKNLLEKINSFDLNFLTNMKSVYTILEEQNTKIKRLEKLYFHNGFSQN